MLLITAARLPAPIQEEATPTPSAQPKPKSPARAKQKSSTVTDAEKSRRAQTGSKQSPFGQFEGTWTGTVTSTATATLLFSSTSSVTLPVTIRVSKNGVVNYAAEQPVQGTLSPDGRVLGWNIQKNISEMVSRVHYSMRLIGPNTASYSDTSVIDGAIAAVSGSSTGTLRKQ